jgi:ATP-binding cassette subfamily B protein
MKTDSSFSALRRLIQYAANYRSRIILASVCSVVNKLFDVMPEILIGVAIDVVVRQEDSFVAALGVTDPSTQMLLLGGLTFIIWAGESLFEYFYSLLWRNLAQALQHDLRVDTYQNVQQLDLAWFEDSSTGNLVSILNDDVNQLERFLDGGANQILQIATAVVAVGTVFFVVSPFIAAVAFTPIPLIILGAFYFQRRAQPLYADVRERVGNLSSRLAANMAGIVTIKSFATEEYEVSRLKEESSAYVDSNSRAIAVSSAFIPVIRMGVLAGFLATFLIGGQMTLDGTLAVGAYGVLVFLTQRLLWPLTGLAEIADLYERAMASTRRILDLLNETAEITDSPSAQVLTELKGRVEFDQISFAYQAGRPVLEKVSFDIPAGNTVAFVGQTGSGKSTLIKLLMRFGIPSKGEIKLDGISLADIQLKSLRQNIGLVSQEVFLFHGSIIDNIRYGSPNASEAEVIQAAKASEAHEFIAQLSEGYHTVVGERGQKLSGGQRQRLSIARALLKNPKILVLDEATSAVDNETEAAIQRSLGKISQGRTTLIIAHRLSTIVAADQIYVIDAGRIAEAGTHQQLRDKNGIYEQLWSVQTGSVS